MVHACLPNFSAVPGVDPTSRQELHYGDTAVAFAALTGCMEVHRYGTHLGNTKALTKAIGVQFVGNRETLKESACFKRHVFFFLDPFFVGFHYFAAQQFCFGKASSGTPVKWQVTSREGLTVRVKSDLKSTKLGVLARHAVFEELDREGYRSWAERPPGGCSPNSPRFLEIPGIGSTKLWDPIDLLFFVGCNGVSSISIFPRTPIWDFESWISAIFEPWVFLTCWNVIFATQSLRHFLQEIGGRGSGVGLDLLLPCRQEGRRTPDACAVGLQQHEGWRAVQEAASCWGDSQVMGVSPSHPSPSSFSTEPPMVTWGSPMA